MYMWENIQSAIGTEAPRILWALGILIVGWIVAMLVAAIARNLLGRTGIDENLNKRLGTDQSFSLTNIISQGLFWLVLIMALVAAFDALNLRGFADPFRSIVNEVSAYLPNLVGAGVLIGITWLLATIVKRLIEAALSATDWDDRLRESANVESATNLSSSLGSLAYWLIWLFFLPAILGALGLDGLLAPVQNMVNDFVGFLPNLFSAAVIGLVGYFVAKIVSDIVTNLLATTGLDRVGERAGFGDSGDGSMKLSKLIGTLVFVFILIPIIVSALDALKLQALSAPATNMLNQIMEAIPGIFAAGVVLAIAWFVGRLIQDLVSNLLAGAGFNRLVANLGFNPPEDGGRTPSQVAGWLVFMALMLFAAVQAADLLGFAAGTVVLGQLLTLFGNVILGLIVFGIGLYLANLAVNVIRESGVQNANLLANIARIAIMLLVGFMALQQMGIGEEIVSTAFSLTLGALAVAFALAFGLGGREMAARTLNRLSNRIETDNQDA